MSFNIRKYNVEFHRNIMYFVNYIKFSCDKNSPINAQHGFLIDFECELNRLTYSDEKITHRTRNLLSRLNSFLIHEFSEFTEKLIYINFAFELNNIEKLDYTFKFMTGMNNEITEFY